MEKTMHLAAQYLAAAGISFLEKEPDDSHTNLGFDTSTGCLQTRELSNLGDKLSLDYKNFNLEWENKNEKVTLDLDGATHGELLKILKKISMTFLNKKYEYAFHYELPQAITNSHVYKLHDAKRLRELMDLRTRVQHAIEATIADNSLDSQIRVWPHHFDTGAYSELPKNTDISVGFGLAIPDSLSKEHYLYISGYSKSGTIETNGFTDLSKGVWRTGDFKGAIIPSANLTTTEAAQFFQEAIDIYKNYS